MNTQSSTIECPECGCSEIHSEYDNFHGRDPLSKVFHHLDDISPTEPIWRYCMSCGIMFDPMKEGFAFWDN